MDAGAHEAVDETGARSGRARTAIVTGSARRVGRAVAEALVANGWRVLVHAREGGRAREAAEAMGAAGHVGADLADPTAADVIAAAASVTVGDADAQLDLLVNCAASFERVQQWEDAGIDGWRRAMDVNARAPYLLTCALLSMLRAARGLVVNVSDRAAHEHWPAYPVHSASKAALESLTVSGAKAFARDGVRMVAIAPDTILPPEEWDESRIARERAGGGVGTPDELVRTILVLADDQSRSGEIIVL